MAKKLLISLIILLHLYSCNMSQKNQNTVSGEPNDSTTSIQFIDQYVLPYNLLFDSTQVGGLSSLDYSFNNLWYIISDDRAEYYPARFYKTLIDYDIDGIDTVIVESVTFMKNLKGELYASHSIDPEAIRFHTNSNTLLYASEGGRTAYDKAPFIREMDTLGNLIKNYTIPSIFNYYEDRGLSKNGGFESLTIENDSIVWFANELPLKEDSELPSYKSAKTPVRLIKFDIKNDKVIAEYAYEIEPISAETKPKGEFSINSVTELISINPTTLLVLERSYITGVGNHVNIYKVNIDRATDVSGFSSLYGASYKPVDKSLFINFSDFGKRIDNIEGMSFGPELADGSLSLICVSDNNFSKKQETQFWLFSIPKSLLYK